ncbi:TIGR02449 family protein [Perlucidibaca piscinae]|uniref:TIGR02449 family protein n=1 Tax=Perlucidibaca piscinae TaxID=392589 RepID=UPI0003B6B675|nr:TIGR02449 family protein [Perlucidibaca piscinae]
MLEQDYQALSRQVDHLVQRLRQLHRENHALHVQNAQLLADRDDLQRKNEQARARVEAIILRLRALEAQS